MKERPEESKERILLSNVCVMAIYALNQIQVGTSSDKTHTLMSEVKESCNGDISIIAPKLRGLPLEGGKESLGAVSHVIRNVEALMYTQETYLQSFGQVTHTRSGLMI